MTHNQIEYYKLQEDIRHNQAGEGETNRHNVETEKYNISTLNESIRHNRVGENETIRHNQAVERETNRTNVANEGIKAATLNETIRNNKATLQESTRSHKANEQLQRDTINESIRHNKQVEDETNRHNTETEDVADREASVHEKRLPFQNQADIAKTGGLFQLFGTTMAGRGRGRGAVATIGSKIAGGAKALTAGISAAAKAGLRGITAMPLMLEQFIPGTDEYKKRDDQIHGRKTY